MYSTTLVPTAGSSTRPSMHYQYANENMRQHCKQRGTGNMSVPTG